MVVKSENYHVQLNGMGNGASPRSDCKVSLMSLAIDSSIGLSHKEWLSLSGIFSSIENAVIYQENSEENVFMGELKFSPVWETRKASHVDSKGENTEKSYQFLKSLRIDGRVGKTGKFEKLDNPVYKDSTEKGIFPPRSKNAPCVEHRLWLESATKQLLVKINANWIHTRSTSVAAEKLNSLNAQIALQSAQIAELMRANEKLLAALPETA